jgi:hypothetical protein
MDSSSNPYIDRDKPKLQRSAVAFVDILGFKELVRKSFKEGKGEDLLRRLHYALQESREYLDPTYSNVFHNMHSPDFSAYSAFTDNIVIGYPTFFFAESELALAFRELSRFQMSLVLDGFFVRGGIAVGNLYMDNILVYGIPLLDAIEAEHAMASTPRIILAGSARDAVHTHLESKAIAGHAQHVQDICKDADGQYFVDYLRLALEDGYFSKDHLQKHKAQIEQKLEENRRDPPIWDKFNWVARYHNEFCDFYGSSTRLKIDINNARDPIRGSILAGRKESTLGDG